jgi:predicted kinase
MIPRVYFGMTYGVAASGKSTLAKFVQKNRGFPTLDFTFPDIQFEIIASDEVRKEVYQRPLSEIFGGIGPEHQLDPIMESKVWGLIETRIKEKLAQGTSVLLDGTALRKADRLTVLSWISSIQREIISFLMVINTSLQTILDWNRGREAQVPELVLEKMYLLRQDKIQQPDLDLEKWGFIYYFEPERLYIQNLLMRG